ncbi:MAG: VWA domain-containing protein, partial [Clostridia bacterium]|nr:VWA domain-containing protein [Clostridia bacterium]
MKNNRTIKKRIISLLLSAVMVISTVPLGTFTLGAAAASGDGRVVDTHTLNQWKQYFGIQSANPNNVLLSTEYAGGIWTDKSVFLPSALPSELTDAKYNGQSVSVEDRGDNFIVSLSALASNKQITGYSTIPTDTVFMLDFSSSMRSKDQNNSSAVDELVSATNSAIGRLLALNHNNRVAVVIYSGNTNGTQGDYNAFSSADGATRVILPLDSYTTSGGVYLDSVTVNGNRNWGAKVNANVKNSAGSTPSLIQVNTQKSTYIQDGIYEAMRVLLECDDVTVSSGVQMGTDRMPIMVLMSDGEPTLANPDYNGNDTRTDLGVSSMYNYSGSLRDRSYTHRETIAFMTMLTAAFAKKSVSAHYNMPTLFYSLGFGSAATATAEAVSVLDTSRISVNINSMWNTFLSGGSVNVYDYTENYQNKSYTVSNSTVASERLTETDKYYVDKYFAANTATALNSAFSDIVNEIIIQSKYYPTYVTGSHDHSGYLTFVDKIGDYMTVSDIKGIIVGEHLFTGERLASYLADIETSLGPVGELTDMGRAFIESIMQRLGVSTVSEAYALLLDANRHRQLYYDSEGFDDYIGWFSDAHGKYVGFWHEGVTAQDMADAVARGATHVIRSYAFLGDTTVVGGVSDTDMMYMTVRVATEINSDYTLGDSMLTWRIPASLIPTVTYNVSVEVDSIGNVISVEDVSLDSGSATSPIRLLFEVELDADITDYNVLEKTGGQITFYTNKYSLDPKDTSKNTYSHFEPSVANERYYYTEDAAVLVKTGVDSYAVYESATKPAYTPDTYYRAYLVYEKLGDGSVRSHTHYEPISSQSFEKIEAGAEQNTWVVPKGALHRYHDTEISEKGAENNKTSTMAYSDHPFIEAEGNNYYTYSTQGNNGKLTVTPATAIKLTKTLGEASPISEESFTFTITGDVSTAVVVRLAADGTETGREALLAGGKVRLAAG